MSEFQVQLETSTGTRYVRFSGLRSVEEARAEVERLFARKLVKPTVTAVEEITVQMSSLTGVVTPL